MNIYDLVAIGAKLLKIDGECSLEKELNELIYMNP